MRGDWQKAYKYLASLTSWNLIPAKEEVLAMLKSKLQEEGLRTYLLSYGTFYQSLSLDELCNMFDLSEKKVQIVFTCIGLDLSLYHQMGISLHHVRLTLCYIIHLTSSACSFPLPFIGNGCKPAKTILMWLIEGVIYWIYVVQVHSVVSKMMMDEALSGSWDQPTRTIVMHSTNPSRLQVSHSCQPNSYLIQQFV